MTDPAEEQRPGPGVVAAVVRGRVTLWIAFVAVHFWLGMLALYGAGQPLGDVTLVYRTWTEQAVLRHYWVGVDAPFVYPIVALVPMLAAFALGPSLYASSWLSIVMLLDAVGFAAITGWFTSRHRAGVAWWWLAFLVLLGPIAVGRIDSITVPLAIVGVLLLATRPVAAAVVLSIATWIKVWPAALLAAIVVTHGRRREIVVAAAVTSAVIVAIALALGSGTHVFSFVTEQTGRGLQVEAPVTTLWLWRAFAGEPGTYIYYDADILTYQVRGEGVDVAAAVMTPVLAVVALAVVALGVRATARGARSTELLPPLALALVTTLIAVNKVGSPQFVMWLAVPVVLGLASNAAGHARGFAVPAVLVLVLAALTQVIYPTFYDRLLGLDPVLLVVITARNALLFVLLGWAVHAVVNAGRSATGPGDNGRGRNDPARAEGRPTIPSQRGGAHPSLHAKD
jgi:hypothetical protein